MTPQLTHHRMSFSFPAQNEPVWAAKVDRWYQLDACAYGLSQAWWQLKESLGPRPAFLILASPGASNETDLAFARSGAISPSKFVHTLPNVRASALCQVMDWAGPMLCLQNGSRTLLGGIREGAGLLSPQWPRIWVMSMTSDGAGHYETHVFVLSADETLAGPARFDLKQVIAQKSEDPYFIAWLTGKDSN
ncbi:MAG: hypothetical protein HY074_09145 [Deltaproteobacteria bacterium]|nr:hypothetical protein [Deltaproteobacteria bacterium]